MLGAGIHSKAIRDKVMRKPIKGSTSRDLSYFKKNPPMLMMTQYLDEENLSSVNDMLDEHARKTT